MIKNFVTKLVYLYLILGIWAPLGIILADHLQNTYIFLPTVRETFAAADKALLFSDIVFVIFALNLTGRLLSWVYRPENNDDDLYITTYPRSRLTRVLLGISGFILTPLFTFALLKVIADAYDPGATSISYLLTAFEAFQQSPRFGTALDTYIELAPILFPHIFIIYSLMMITMGLYDWPQKIGRRKGEGWAEDTG